jgi:heat shock 70kDa protein 1/2/6/8
LFPTHHFLLDAKRLIGRKFKNLDEYDLKRWPFKVINNGDAPKFEVLFQNKMTTFSPEHISAAVLIKMKETAEDYLNDVVTDAVITIPAHFNDAQRQATKDAAEIAGFNVLQLINEPTAAAIAYGLKSKLKSGQNILVFDMGGGTFDVSILSIIEDVYEVKAVGGDTHLGGEDFNNKLLDHFMAEIRTQHGVDIAGNKIDKARLLKQCELAKISLSTAKVAEVRANPLANSIDFKSSITRARFEELVAEFIDKAIEKVEDTIKQSKLKKSEIDEIVLVGGSTYIPKVQQMLQECFEGKTLNKSVNPEEAVAYGAAIYASVLSGNEVECSDLLLLDVTPHSLGVETLGDVMSVIIKANTTIPVQKSYNYITAEDNQTSVDILVYEGEEETASKNNLLGTFKLTGIPPAPVGKEKLIITMNINSDGILKVTAVCESNGASKDIVIEEYKSRLSKEEIKKNFEDERKLISITK